MRGVRLFDRGACGGGIIESKVNQANRAQHTREQVRFICKFRRHLLFNEREKLIDAHLARARARLRIRRTERVLKSGKRALTLNTQSLRVGVGNCECNR